jgi:hypothetical protein
MTVVGTTCTFDSHDLQTETIITNNISHEGIPEKNAVLYQLAHANKSVIPFISYPCKKITIEGTIVAASITALDTALDTFRGYFNGKNKNLDIGYNGSTRRYTATLNNISIERPGGLAFAYFSLEFICTIPFGFDTTNTTAVNTTGNTAATYSPTYTFLGSAPLQSPVITVTFSAMSGNAAAQSVTIGNQDTGQSIVVNRIWATTDVLIIDTVNETVKVNGNEVEFTGAFPVFEPVASTITYVDTLATRTFAFNVVYAKRYM